MAEPGAVVTSKATVIGNVYDKYGTRNPVARLLMRGFLDAVSALYLGVRPKTVLEVGCGEGLLAHHLMSLPHQPDRFDACDLSLEKLAGDLHPEIHFRAADIYQLPFETGEFDWVVCCEVLEHLDSPNQALHELTRVAACGLLVSTPREPIWRALNLLRGKYVREWGNTPGHIQHFSQSQLLELLASQVRIRQVRSPLPWTVVLGDCSRS